MTDSVIDRLLDIADTAGLQTDDVLTVLLPLFRQVCEWHEQTFVAPLNKLATLTLDEAGALTCSSSPVSPKSNAAVIEKLQRPASSALQVIGQDRRTSDEVTGLDWKNLDVSDGQGELEQPAWITGYRSWEQLLEHHDALTDVLLLGQLLASLSLGLDFHESDELTQFAEQRQNLFALNPRLHPVVAGVIVEMTELNRHRRVADLSSVIQRLENYRDLTHEVDVTRSPEFAGAGVVRRRQLIQSHLRDRLFDISRRNRLLYFKPSTSSLNFTMASVPLVMNLASVKLEQLFVWHSALASEIAEGRSINPGRWLRFEDQPYLPAALDKIIADARRDRAEFGFAQLRLVIAFLHWHDLKDSRDERIVSPLLLLPVDLSRRKGVRDQYVLDPHSNEAEVNPALRHHLHQLYGLRLPASIDLRETSLEQFHRDLATQIHATEPGVTLRFIDKPEIRLIRERARQRLAQYQQRQRLRSATARSKDSFDYSYDLKDFRPLGLHLFRAKVVPAPFPQRAAAGGAPEPRMPHLLGEAPELRQPAAAMVRGMAGGQQIETAAGCGAESGSRLPQSRARETERQTFAVQTERQANPFSWDFDLCSLTVGNFNYRKMSLVRDYGELLGGNLMSPAFDRVFSLEARVQHDVPDRIPLDEQWPVVPGDATQAAAVALARTGRSCIIQGPPGTGKSQTITNLIADYVARGKRVLFVCEKRAAIDVVFHRLRQQGLDDLCCLIHDSQTDKKSFVLDLKRTYEHWLADRDGADTLRAKRTALVQKHAQDLESLTRFDTAMCDAPHYVQRPVRELLHRMVELRGHESSLSGSDQQRLPDFSVWSAHSELARRLAETLREVTDCGALAEHPFRWLGDGVINAERPLEALSHFTERAEVLLDELEAELVASKLPPELWSPLDRIEALISFASRAAELAVRGQIELLDPKSKLTKSLKNSTTALSKSDAAVQKAQAKTTHWREKLPAAEVTAALAQARRQEPSLLKWLKPSWWKLGAAISARYDFRQHTVVPTFTQVLTELEAEHSAIAARDSAREDATVQWGADPSELAANCETLRADKSPLGKILLSSTDGASLAVRLQAMTSKLTELNAVLTNLLTEFRSHNLATLSEIVRDLRDEADVLPELLPLLSELTTSPLAFADALRQFALTPDQLEYASARAALETFYRAERWLPRFDGRVLSQRANRIDAAERDLLNDNAALLRAEVHRRFRDNVQLSSQSVTQLDSNQRAFKKSYAAGRRDLEHEFGKSMRYKSIRDLAAGDTGRVVRDLKPVWLMSPLSVSDTLPLSPDLFDVVIFDEASQIPVEEAVPAMFRAPQVIVVGDEMQLPPTSFFSSARSSDDDSLEVEVDGERIAMPLDADSFLTQSAKNLPATLLAWHYRSRSESLIAFSNAAFYAGNLFTIPDRSLPTAETRDIIVDSVEVAVDRVRDLLSRPLSFHFLEHSPYESRRNAGEAEYIARLVRELLLRETGRSIGIVAFSEAQQSEIESALEALSTDDADFAARLEQELVREDDDQFVGLFVKNLENVQGDERDIILLSICYGPDANGKMLMNFGPINQRGGEKRLNVIFSRARHHMAVVSSIRHTAITNDYNDGAAALKSFLHYAESISRGDCGLGATVLQSLNPRTRKQLANSVGLDAVITQLSAALRERGYVVDEHVGQSRFRCDLGIRTADSTHYAVGVIVDTARHYENRDVIERCVTQPGILRAFGWRVAIVLTRDWLTEPHAVLDRLTRLTHDDVEAAVVDESEAAMTVVIDREGEAPAEPQAGRLAAIPPTTPSTSAATSSVVSHSGTHNTLRLEFISGGSAKFWEITQEGSVLQIRWGRLGTNGQAQTKTLGSAELADREREKLTAEKLRKGYSRVEGS